MLNLPQQFDEIISTYGKRLNIKLVFGNTTLEKVYIDNTERDVNGELFTSIMNMFTVEVEKYEIDDEKPDDIKEATSIQVLLGAKINEDDEYKYIDYGEFKVYGEIEDCVDTDSYKITLYDYMINSHINYDDDPLDLDYDSGKITVLNLLQAVCDKLGYVLMTTDFANATQIVDADKYADQDVTYRDILDEIAKTTASYIKTFNDELYVCYPFEEQETGIIIDENKLESLTIGKLVGTFNTIILGRSETEDNVFYCGEEEIAKEDRIAIRFDDVQLMDSHREDFLQEIWEKINGISYYAFEYVSFGFGFFEFGDIVTLRDLAGNKYKTILLNIIQNTDTGIKEKAYSEETEYSTETDYSIASSLEKRVKKAEIRVNKQEGEIEARVSKGKIIAGLNLEIEENDERDKSIVKIYGNAITIEADHFSLSEDGTIICENATVKGKIEALEGYIGDEENGFTIGSKAIYNGKEDIESTESGIYIGTDGINIGRSNYFLATKDGHIYASNGIEIHQANFLETELSETGEIHLTSTAAGTDYINELHIYGENIEAGTINLIIANKSRSDEATSTKNIELELTDPLYVLSDDVYDEIYYKEGSFTAIHRVGIDDEGELYELEEKTEETLSTESISTYKNDTYLYISEYENLNYFANYNQTVDTETSGKSVELYGALPYLDFHYKNSDDDYTARIIQANEDTLIIMIPGTLKVTDLSGNPTRFLAGQNVSSNNYGTGNCMHGCDKEKYTYQVKYESEKLKFFVDGQQIASLVNDNTGDSASSGGSSPGGSGFPGTGTSQRSIFGIKRSLSSSNTVWERTDDAQGLVVNDATTDGTEVENDFDNYYPWSDIISCNYDTEKCEILAYLGDVDFTFTPEDEHVEVMTLIPDFWWKRWQDDENEYIQISSYEAEGFEYMPAFMVGRYPTSIDSDSSRVHSVSGATPLTSTTIENFRLYSRSLGDNWGELDIWHWAAIQMLYLVEYANYNCQAKVGYGMCTVYKQIGGGCDDLGMKSGCFANDYTASVSYRGIEDIWGNVACGLDGIWHTTYVPYVCEDANNYTFNESVDYQSVSATMPSANGYISKLSYDENYPSIMLPIATNGSSSTYMADYYSYSSQTRGSVWVGRNNNTGSSGTSYLGLWCVCLIASSSSNAGFGGRLLLTSK